MELLVSGGMTTSGAPRSRSLLLHAAAVFAFLYLPILVLVIYSFNGQGVGGFPPRNLTLDWYRILFADIPIWDSVLNSLQVALVAMLIALAFGIPAALALDRAQFPGKALFRRLVLLPLILPGIITGLSLAMLFKQANVKTSILTIILGHGTALISVATTEVFAGLQKLDRAQEEASLDLGANYWQTFWAITVPNLKLPIIGAALLIFTLSMDEIAVSFFLIGRDNTLPLEIWGRLRRGITPEINAISTVIFMFSMVTIVLWYRLRMRAESSVAVGEELAEHGKEQI
jgi:spermidine/putrescine transport system permease protein